VEQGSGGARFFFAGKGRLRLHHDHFNSALDVRYRYADGSYDPEGLARIRHFFRSRDDGREGAIALRLIELLAYVQDRYRPRRMTLLSGYRSTEFNEHLRAGGGATAQASLHTQGLAADITLAGVNHGRVWRDLRDQRTGGVGYYRGGHFLHIDTGPPRFWEETSSRVSENLSTGNARAFVRTDFDRYPGIDGAVAELHNVTALPLLIAPQATLTGDGTGSQVTIAPEAGTHVEDRDGCFAITAPAEAYRFRVRARDDTRASRRSPSGARSTLVLTTCVPRIEKTPVELVSNPIEIRF
jgi:uncharacterized protein YcbK (DUF882 family)